MSLLATPVTHRSPLSAFPKVILVTFPAGRIGGIVLFRGLLASVSIRLIIPLSLITIFVLPLQLTTLLTPILVTTIPVSTMLSLLLLVLKHTISHFFELVKAMFDPIRMLYTISNNGRLVSSIFYSQRYVRSKHL